MMIVNKEYAALSSC